MSLDGVQLHYVESMAEANEFMHWLGERRPILAMDTETTGLKPWKDHVRLIQFGDGEQGWTIRWDRWGGLALEAMQKYQDEIVYHNCKYDLQMLQRWCDVTVPIGRVHDTAIMARLIDPTGPRGLKVIAPALIDAKAAVGESMLEKAMAEHSWTWATIPYDVPIYTTYAAIDTVLTARLFEILYPQVRARCPNAYDLERSFTAAVVKMEQRGSQIDRAYTTKAHEELQRYVDELETWCVHNYGVKPGSNQAVVARLASEGVSFIKRTDKGRVALDADVLEGIDHPLAEVVLRRRRAQKIATTYLRNFLAMADEHDVVRPIMDTMGARTGRMSMELFQTLPRRSEANPLAALVRNCVVPREGNVLMMCDFSQIEFRVLAHLAQDEGLVHAFDEGDFFLNVARELWRDSSMEKKDERRQHCKNAMYAKAYGAGLHKFAMTAGLPDEEAEPIWRSLDERYPGIKRLQNEVDRVAHERMEREGRPYVLSPLTRQPYYLDNDDKVYALVNYMIQGTAASILKMKTVELDLAGLGDLLTLLVHDEVIADVPIDQVADVADVMNKTMNDATLLRVPVTADVELGRRWGEKGQLKLEDLCEPL